MSHNPLSPSSPKAGSDDNSDESAQRKKKNADAQAAFRARRANYISTLEETVTNLEKVVVTLQQSCREASDSAAELRAENIRLQNEARDREKFWRALWQARKTGMPPDPADDSCLPSYAQPHSSPASSSSSSSGLLSPTTTAASHLQDSRLRYSGNPSVTLIPPSQPYMSTSEYPQRSPALGCTAAPSPTATSGQTEPSGSPISVAYAHYPPYVSDENSRENSWSPPATLYSRQDCNPAEGPQSPSFVESPTATARELAYSSQYSTSMHPSVVDATYGPEQQLYMFSPSRSVSPALTQASTASTTSSTSISVSSTSMTPAPYQFTFPEGAALHDRPEFAFQRPFTLQGGTANVAVAGTVGDVLRHKLTSRGNPAVPTATSAPFSHTDTALYHEDETYQTGMAPAPVARYRRNIAPETQSQPPPSRSPSPTPHVSGTLAIIKAQTFGALRRTRGRTKTSSESLAKAAVDALSARGLGLGLVTGPPSKRQRVRAGDDDSRR